MLSEPNISYKPFWGICRPLKSWRANSPNPIQIYCAKKDDNLVAILDIDSFEFNNFSIEDQAILEKICEFFIPLF